MSTSTSAPPIDGAQPRWPQRGDGARVPRRARRRSVPHLLLGAVMVLACATGFVLFTAASGGRHAVLALARPMTVGHVLVVSDLRSVDVGVDDGVVDVIDADQAGSVVGRPIATSLPAGVVLSPAVFGAPPAAGAGQAVVAVAVKPGQIPSEVAAGASVLVVEQPSTTAALPGSTTRAESAGSGEPWSAVVVSVAVSTDGQTTVASLRMRDDAGREVAAVTPGQLSIVLVADGGR